MHGHWTGIFHDGFLVTTLVFHRVMNRSCWCRKVRFHELENKPKVRKKKKRPLVISDVEKNQVVVS